MLNRIDEPFGSNGGGMSIETSMDANTLKDLIYEVLVKVFDNREGEQRFMSTKLAASKLGVSLPVFRSLVRSGSIRFSIISNRRKFTREDLDEYCRKKNEETVSCLSQSQMARTAGSMTSNFKEYDILARRASQTKMKQRC